VTSGPEDEARAGNAGDSGIRKRRGVPAGAALAVCVALFSLVLIVGLRLSAERRDASECRRRLEALGRAAEKYADGHKGYYPYGNRALEELLVKYIRARRMLVCPKSRRTYRWTKRRRHRSDPAHLLLAWEKPGTTTHGVLGGHYFVLFVGGVVRDLSPEALERLLAAEMREPASPPALPEKPRPGLREPPEARPPGALRHVPPGTRFTIPDPHLRDGFPGEKPAGAKNGTTKKSGSGTGSGDGGEKGTEGDGN
jgi:hypothetical protein